MNFTGKNVLITGGSRGIGKETSLLLSSLGLKVWINYNSSKESAEKIKSEIEANSGKAEIIGFNVSDEKAFCDAISKIISEDGELSYLVNNAGITKDKLSIKMSVKDFSEVIDTNLLSTFIGSREALKAMMKKRFGAVVNVASIVAQMGNAGQANYVASKGATISMTKTFAREGAARGIRFNSVAPGFIATDMTANLKDEAKENFENSIPLKKLGKATDVANAIAFLLSDESAYITGETLKVNGGLYM